MQRFNDKAHRTQIASKRKRSLERLHTEQERQRAAAKAGTAIGSLYQFFPDKAAIFKAMELRHTDRVKHFWEQTNTPEIVQLPLREMIRAIAEAMADLFDPPVSRVVFVQFYTARQIFQSIDDSMTPSGD